MLGTLNGEARGPWVQTCAGLIALVGQEEPAACSFHLIAHVQQEDDSLVLQQPYVQVHCVSLFFRHEDQYRSRTLA